MLYLEYTRSRLRAVLSELARLAHSEFPYPDSLDAFNCLQHVFQRELTRLEQLNERIDPAKIKQRCGLALTKVADYLPLLGFILRSTNVRNAFEIFTPLLRLAGAVLEPNVAIDDRKTRLVLSSEWDFSPFTYREIPDLRGFVLIGFPAPEAENPLLIPLAGHELGHSVWSKKSLELEFVDSIRDSILDSIKQQWKEYTQLFIAPKSQEQLTSNLFAQQTWEPAAVWAMRQAEESFCDFLGLAIFGASFLRAFSYLLSPNVNGVRSLFYPSMRKRVQNLVKASELYQITVPTGYMDLFDDDQNTNIGGADQFRLSLADRALDQIVDEIIETTGNLIRETEIVKSTQTEVQRICDRFRKVVPAEQTKGIADILNAAWALAEVPDLWDDTPEVIENKNQIFKDLVLKNIEVFEIEQRLKSPS